MPVNRSECSISQVLDRVGDKWSLLIIRDLLFYEKHEYTEFIKSPEKIATNILAMRLKSLSEADLIAETAHPKSETRKLYYLTDQGKELLPVLTEIAAWGKKHLPGSQVSPPIANAL